MGLDEKTAALVLRQVEFYFSDSNLPGDKFLRQCVEEAADGMVSLPLICSFGRMRSHLNLKESGPDNVPPETAAAVAEVLRKSTVLKVSEDGLKVGRTVPMSKFEEVQAAIEARSIAVGPLRWNVTMEEVEAFFSQHTKVKSVRLPRHPGGKAFCGSAILELESEEEAKKALDFKLVFDGVEQEIRAKKDFDAEMEMKQVKAREESYEQRTARKDAEIRFTKGLIVAFFLQKVDSAGESEKNNVKKEEPMSVDTEKSETMKGSPPADGVSCEESVAGEDESAKEKDELAQGEVKPAAEADTTKEELEPSKEELDVSREDIKEAFKGFGFIKYVDYSRGASSGYLRFDKPEEVQKARTAAVLAESGGIVVKDYIATLEAVDGAAEEEYWRTKHYPTSTIVNRKSMPHSTSETPISIKAPLTGASPACKPASVSSEKYQSDSNSIRRSAMAGRGRRRALADLGDNDSPVIGLFQVVHNCAADQNYPWDLKCVLDNSKFPIQSPYTDPSETPIGENLLRSQVQLLLQSVESDAPTNHKPAVSLRALCHLQPNSMESPALKLVAPTPVKTPRHSVSTCIFPAPISYDSALNGKSRNSALNSCQDQELSAKSCIQEDGGREIHPVETKEEDSASKLFVDVHISPSCEIPKFEYLPISRGSDDRHIIITESVYPGNNRHIVQTAPLISEGYALGFKTTRTLQFDSPNKTPSGNTSCSAGMTFLQAEEIGLLMREQVTEDDTTSEWSTLVNVSSAGRRRGTPYPKGSFVAHIEEDEDDNLESGFEEDGEGHNNRGPPENGSKKVRISHDSDVEM